MITAEGITKLTGGVDAHPDGGAGSEGLSRLVAAPFAVIGGPLQEADYNKFLQQSGIRREWVDRAGIRRVDDAGGRAAVGHSGGGDYSGILIPYALPGEARPREYLLRRDNPDVEYKSDGKTKREVKKYIFPPGRGNILYFPPGTSPEQLRDNSIRILVVEGAKKAIACQQAAWDCAAKGARQPRYLAVAVSGVWNWRGVTGKQTGPNGSRQDIKGPIVDLDRLTWKGRRVVIAYDTNVITLESVQAARSELTKELRKRGASIHWLRWPANTPQLVNGLDDLLAMEGPERVIELVEGAKPYREAAAGVRVWTLTELMAASFPSPVPIADELIAEGETIAFIGKPKLGKSRLMQQFGLDVSRGMSYLGHIVLKPRKVLMLDLENRPARARARFVKMAGEEPNENLLIYAPETLTSNSITLLNPNGLLQLEQLVEDTRPEVLIVDNWRLFLGGDENKTEVVVRGLKALSGLRRFVPGLGIIVVHHVRKQQQGENQPKLRVDPSSWVEAASGHYAFIAHVDACFGLEREQDRASGEELIVFGGVARNAQARTLLLDEDIETLRFRLAEGEESAKRIFTQVETGFWSVVGKVKAFTFSEAIQCTGTKNRKAMTSMLRKAEDMGLIDRGLDRVYRVRKG